jgi:hypothetical protein
MSDAFAPNLHVVLRELGLEPGQLYTVRVQAKVKGRWLTRAVLRARWPELPEGGFKVRPVRARFWRLRCSAGRV